MAYWHCPDAVVDGSGRINRIVVLHSERAKNIDIKTAILLSTWNFKNGKRKKKKATAVVVGSCLMPIPDLQIYYCSSPAAIHQVERDRRIKYTCLQMSGTHRSRW